MAPDNGRPRKWRSRRKRRPGRWLPDGTIEDPTTGKWKPGTGQPAHDPLVPEPSKPGKPTPGDFDPDLDLSDRPVFGIDHRQSFAELKSSHPLLLLPVRLETRFEGHDLKIRIYPDQIHLDEHEPLLTDEEQIYGRKFWRKRLGEPGADQQALLERWLVEHVPPRRAAWVARKTRPVVTIEGTLKFKDLPTRSDASPSRAAGQPDRWCAVGYCDGDELFVRFGNQVPSDLACAPRLEEAESWSDDPGALPVDEGVGWMVDYAEARRVGMGITVALNEADYGRVAQHGLTLLVIGIRGESPGEGREVLEDLLRAHLYTDGLEFLPQGTPTNNTDEGSAGWTEAVDDLSGFFARELDGEGLATSADSDALRLSTALGLDEDLLARVLHGTGAEESTMAAMNRALWPVTLGRYFDDLLAPQAEAGEDEDEQISVLPASAIDYTRDFFLDHVRGGAPLPVLAVGPQPYGVLPVRRTREGLGLREPADNLEWILLDLKQRWRESLAAVPRLDPVLGDRIGSEPEDDAVTILGSLPHPARFLIRRLGYYRDFLEIVPEYLFGGGIVQYDSGYYDWIFWYLTELEDVRSIADHLNMIDRWGDQISSLVSGTTRQQHANGWVELMRAFAGGHQARQDPLDRLAGYYFNGAFCVDHVLSQYPPTMDDPKILWSFFSDDTDERLWNRALVESPGAGPGARARDYLGSLADRIGPGLVSGPVGTLFEAGPAGWDSGKLHRSRALREIAREWALLSTPKEPQDGSIFGPGDLDPKFPTWDGELSDEFLSDQPLLYQLLDSLELPDDIPVNQRAATRTALNRLAELASVDLDELELRLRETLGLASHRLDAWFTGLARKRLGALREPDQAGGTPVQGVQLGGFAWVQDLKPDALGTRESQGFVHAPSLGHAATAAVLRAGWNSCGTNEANSPVAIDLGSDRVRLASWLLDGIRQGQALGELLGCRFERELHDLERDEYIDACRRAVLESQGIQRDPRGPVDGLDLAALFDGPGVTVEQGAVTLAASSKPSGKQLSDVWNALDGILHAMDAVADAGLADSVHHLLQGNHARSSATLDAITTGAVAPPELRSIETPRPGPGVTQRVLITLGAKAHGEDSSGGWNKGPRARLDPSLESWATTVLGDPGQVVCRVSFEPLEDEPVPAPLTVTMKQLGLSALDAVFEAPTGEDPGDSDWARRIAASVLDLHAYGAFEGRLSIDLDGAPTEDQVSFREFAQLARSVRSLLGRARALEARDLALPGAELPSGTRVQELEKRVRTFRGGFERTIEDLENALPAATDEDPSPVGSEDLDVVRGLMLEVAGRGLHAAIPSTGWTEEGRASLYADAWSLARRGRARIEAVYALETTWSAADDGATPAAETRVSRATTSLAELLGKGFPLLPHFTPANPGEAAAAFAASDALLGGEPAAATGWLRQVARVRPEVAQLEDVLTLSELIRDRAALAPTVGQLPDQDVWVNTTAPSDRTRGYLGLWALDHGGLDAIAAGAPLAGLVVDAWTERIPATEVTTGVALNFDAPSSRPPQSLLLLVPPEEEAWSFDLVVDSLLETLEAAQLRAVDPDVLAAHGHQFPAIYPPGSLSAGPQG